MSVPGLLGKKLGMTQVVGEGGGVVPVTVLKAGPCGVVQRKTAANDGYEAVQLGLVEFVKPRRVNKPATGHLKKNNIAPLRILREIRLAGAQEEAKAGDKVVVEQVFKADDRGDVGGVQGGRRGGGGGGGKGRGRGGFNKAAPLPGGPPQPGKWSRLMTPL